MIIKTITAVAQEVLRTVLNESEPTMRKAMSELIQGKSKFDCAKIEK